jgi:hypothetical protein
MKIETKFDLGQAVWLVKRFPKRTTTPCPGCNGLGNVLLADGTFGRCPKCYGNKTKVETAPADWHVRGPMTIGNVRVSLFQVRDDNEHEDERMYMCRETGVGSGTLWREQDLFKTRQEAGDEASERRRRGDE